MTVKYGFYNAIANDRLYDSVDFSNMFNGLLTDGIFQSIDAAMVVIQSTGMNVLVQPGKAWFRSTWTINDSNLQMAIGASDPVLNRIDSLALRVDTTARINDFMVYPGTKAASPVPPTITLPGSQYILILANISIPATITTILNSHITSLVGSGSCPYVTMPVSVFQGAAPILEHQIFS